MKKYKRLILDLKKWKFLDAAILVILFFIACWLRIYLLNKNLFFGPEQGIDLLTVRDLVINHKLILIGHNTAAQGIFHGPLYQYLAAIPFYFSKGNPLDIEYFFAFLSSLTVFFIYILGKELFNRRVGIISAILFTFSFGAVEMARWLSHPPLIILISCIFFIFLNRFLKGRRIYLIWSALFYGIASQTEFTYFLVFSFMVFAAVIIFFKDFKKQKIWYLAFSFLIAVVSAVGNFALFDLRHNFLISKGYLQLLTGHTGFYSNLGSSIYWTFNNFIALFYHTIVPFHFWTAVVIFVLGIFVLLKDKNSIGPRILLIWLISPLIVFILLRYSPLMHYLLSALTGIIILTSFLMDKFLSKNRMIGFFTLLIIVYNSMYYWVNYLPTNTYVYFETNQSELNYADQVYVINEIYKEAAGKPFFFQAYTIPYWLQEEWQYLFWYFGTTKFHYLPINNNPDTLFVIIQHDPGNESFQKKWLDNVVSKWGTKVDTFTYGALTVEKLKVR